MWLVVPSQETNIVWDGELALAEEEPPIATRGGREQAYPLPHDLPRVSIGRPEIWRLEEVYESTDLPLAIRTKLAEAEFRFVRLSCSFRPPRDDVRIEWARFTVQLLTDGDGRQPIAFDLHPMEVTREARRNVKVTLSPTIKFREVEVGLGSVEFGFEYPELQPVITGSGAGESVPSWDYEAQPGLRLQGSKWMHLLVRAPKDMRAANARLELVADVSHRGIRLPAALGGDRSEHARALTVRLWS
jgi:hypothetical protein